MSHLLQIIKAELTCDANTLPVTEIVYKFVLLVLEMHVHVHKFENM